LKKIDVLLINDAEARQLSGQYSLVKASKTYWNGPKFLIVKKGEHGACFFMVIKFSLPLLFPGRVFDPTGAGDTFCRRLYGPPGKNKRLSFENMKTAIIVGSAMASFCVEKFGPTRLERNFQRKTSTNAFTSFVNW
jgi:sugar/nucleoside kinase (ribokinase family)